MIQKISIGTRGSQLALYQAHKVQEELSLAYPDLETEVKIIKTKGDKILDVALSKIGDKGLFTKELEVELLDGGIDLAVHSLKDLPTQLPAEFQVAAVLERADFRDALVSTKGLKLADLNAGHKIATSSLRRIAGLKKLKPGVQILDIRGNVNTRLQKMADGYCDGMIMAAAGLKRLGLEHHISEILEPDTFIPAVAQGAIAIEIASKNTELAHLLQAINHVPTQNSICAERAFMRTLEGGCQVPVGAFSNLSKGKLELTGFVASLDGSTYLQESLVGKEADAEMLGELLAERLLDRGAGKILYAIRSNQ